jgi:hypothetical protein
MTIGKHGSPWTPEMARVEAKRLLAEVAADRDPAAARQADRKALSFRELIDLYLAEGVTHKKLSTIKQEALDDQSRSRTYRTPSRARSRQAARGPHHAR